MIKIPQKMIFKMSPTVNCIYSLAMIVEGLSLDVNMGDVHEQSVKMREQVAVRKLDFGNWSELMEEKIMSLDYSKLDIMKCCIETMHILSKKVESRFRQFDASFDFYQRSEIDLMRQKDINKACFNDIYDLVYKYYMN